MRTRHVCITLQWPHALLRGMIMSTTALQQIKIDLEEAGQDVAVIGDGLYLVVKLDGKSYDVRLEVTSVNRNSS